MNEDKIVHEILTLKEDMADVKEKLEKTATVGQLRDTEDKIISLLTKIDTEVTAIRASQQRHEEALEDHEERIGTLELKTA